MTAKRAHRRKIEPGIWRTTAKTYMVRYYDPGRRERAKNFAKLADARNFKASVRITELHGEFVDPKDSRTSFSEVAARFMDQKLGLRRRTREKYEGVIRIHLVPAFGSVPVGEMTPDLIERWVLGVAQEEVKPGKTHAPETVRGCFAHLASVMTFAVERGLISKSPCRSIQVQSSRQNNAISPRKRLNGSLRL